MAKKLRVRMKTPQELADAEFQRRTQRQIKIRKQANAATDRLSKKRREFVLNIAAYHWVSSLPPDADEATHKKEERRWAKLRNEFLREADNPLELHLFAFNWNCDEGPRPIQHIVRSPHCDAGTALWLYWENDPYFYQSFQKIQDADGWDQEWLRIMRSIERRFIRGDFTTAKIPFDPEPWVTDKYADAEWAVREIPQVMYNPVTTRRRRKRT